MPHSLRFGGKAVLLLIVLCASRAQAQASFTGGYTWQKLSIGPFSYAMGGIGGDVSIRTGKRVDVLIGFEQGTFRSGFPLDPDKDLWTLRAGIHARLLKSEGLDFGVAVGAGIYGADMDSEDLDSGGFSGFLQGRLTLHPLPVVGIYAGGTLQALSGIGRSPGGSTTGLTLGVQLRSSGW